MKKHQIGSVKLAAIVAFLFIHQLLNAQWPQWRGLMRDGFSTESNLLKVWPTESPKLAWSSDTIGDGFASAIIQNNIVYAAGTRDSSEIMTAFDINGKMVWQKEFVKALKRKDWGPQRSTPTFYKDRLYIVTVAGDIACIQTKTGALDWIINIPSKFEGAIGTGYGFCESPLIVDDKVILTPCGKNTTIIALNSSTGETIWLSESISDSSSYVSPVLIQGEGKKLIVTNTKKHFVAVDIITGKMVWKERGSTTSVPLPGNKQVYFSSLEYGGKMLKIGEDLNRFDFIWCDSLKIKDFGGGVKIGSRLFGTYENGKGLFCIDWVTGKKQVFNNAISGANLLAADGMLYSYEDKGGRISLLKPTENSIEIAGSFKITMGKGSHLSHMSIGNGLLFVRHGKALMAYNIKQQ